MIARREIVVDALRDPASLAGASLAQWEALVAQARAADLLPRIALDLAGRGLLEDVPHAPREHLVAARVLADAQRASVRREVAHIRRALEATGVVPILLKGAAYVALDLPFARGRLFSDVDILVPRERLPEVEAALMLHGWATTHHDAYDQRYYREWMHELPPMRHVRRGTVIDVHHAIVPLTGRRRSDASRLFAAAVDVPGMPGVRVLAPADRVVHSATHLFHNEEFSHGLRDLADLDGLVRIESRDPSFWPALVARAAELDLARPVHYALRYASAILGTPVPPDVVASSAVAAPPAPLRALMDALFARALRAPHPATADALSPLAHGLLYWRAHWLRMPLPMLVRHLTVKALRREPESTAPRG